MSEIAAVALVATGGLEPDLNIVFDVDEDTAAKRLNPLLDRMEAKGKSFHSRVRNGYLELCQQRPDRYMKMDASCGGRSAGILACSGAAGFQPAGIER